MGFVNDCTRPCFKSSIRSHFAKKLYEPIDQLNQDLDRWLKSYNEEWLYPERYCFGKTPMDAFLDSKSFVEQKMLDLFVQHNS